MALPSSRRLGRRSPDGTGATIHLEGGTYHERAVFADAVAEVLGEVENPRYLLIRAGRNPLGGKVVDYHPVPLVLGIRKDRAEIFHQAWQKRVGPAQLVYTRTAEAKPTLLAARARSFATATRKATARIERWI